MFLPSILSYLSHVYCRPQCQQCIVLCRLQEVNICNAMKISIYWLHSRLYCGRISHLFFCFLCQDNKSDKINKLFQLFYTELDLYKLSGYTIDKVLLAQRHYQKTFCIKQHIIARQLCTLVAVHMLIFNLRVSKTFTLNHAGHRV